MDGTKPQELDLKFPVGGLVRRYGYQSQEPGTTPDCENVRAYDTLEGRERGGSRPGMVSCRDTEDMPVAPIQALGSVEIVYSGEQRTMLYGVADSTAFLWQLDDGDWVDGAAVTGESLDTGLALQHAVLRQKVYFANPDGPPLVLDPATGVVAELAATAGTVPEDCTAVCAYRDRLFLAGADHLWYASRKGAPGDWNFFLQPPDMGVAMCGSCAKQGLVGQNPVALIPRGDDYLIVGCDGSMWVMLGDLAANGELRCVTTEAGILGPSAWCELPDKAIVFLSQSGLWLIAPGAQQATAFSSSMLPDELQSVDPTHTIAMCFDADAGGIHLSIVPPIGDGATQGQHWFIDMTKGAFWPVAFADVDMQPVAMCKFPLAVEGFKRTLLGCLDGAVRYFDDDAADDDGEAIASYVLYGPVRMGGMFHQYAANTAVAILDKQSADVTWTVQTGDCGEDAVNDPKRSESGTWEGGRNFVQLSRVSGGDIAVKVASTGQWAIEAFGVLAMPAGKQR